MSYETKPITLQINTAPTDNRFLRSVLKHQISVLGNQVSEIHITADVRPSRKGRFHFSDEQITEFNQILEDIEQQYDKAVVHYVDYSDETIKEVAQKIWGRDSLPVKDYRGGPFYSYIYGLHRAETDYVFHLDSDIFLGGGYGSWCLDAIELLKDDPDIAIIKPLSGPPKKDRSAPHQFGQPLYPYQDLAGAFYSDSFTTRIYFTEKERIQTILKELPIQKPRFLRSMIGRWQRNPMVKAPEQLLSDYLSASGYCRVDYLGAEPGLWALHPPFRSEEFYSKLDDIIESVEKNRVPDAQRGHYDINHAFVDWTSAIDDLPVYRRKKARRRFK